MPRSASRYSGAPASTIWPGNMFFSMTKPDIGAATGRVLRMVRVASNRVMSASGTSKNRSFSTAVSRRLATPGSLVEPELSASKYSSSALYSSGE